MADAYIGDLDDGIEGRAGDLIEIERPSAVPGEDPVSLRVPLDRSQFPRRITRAYADSPVAVTTADRGRLIRVDAGDGDVVVDLDVIGTLGDFEVDIVKVDDSANTVTINRAGANTINGGTSVVLAARGRGVALMSEAGTINWAAALWNPAQVPSDSPAFTGTPTAPTADPGTDTDQLATTAYVLAAIAALVASSPSALDTLNELAAALGNDANFSITVTNALAAKAPLVSPALSGVPTVPTAAPGTNTTQAASTAFVKAALTAASPVGPWVENYFTVAGAPNNVIPYDDTIPQNSEGYEIASVTVTVAAGQKVEIQGQAHLSCSTNSNAPGAALFRSGVANALDVAIANVYNTSNRPSGAYPSAIDNPGAGTHTYTMRVGAPSGTTGVNTINGSASRLFGGAMKTGLRARAIPA